MNERGPGSLSGLRLPLESQCPQVLSPSLLEIVSAWHEKQEVGNGQNLPL